MRRDFRKLRSVLQNVVLTAINMLLGIMVTIVMLGSGTLHLLLKMEHLDPLTGFDAFFEAYIIHPATGIVYLICIGTFIAHQSKISHTQRLYINVAMSLLSIGIFAKVLMLFG